MSCEPAFRRYLAVFDGNKKDFSEVEHLFDSLYHEKMTFTFKDGEIATREDMKRLHADQLSKGSKITLIHFRKIGVECIDVKMRVENEQEDIVLHKVYSLEDNKIAMGQEVDSFLSIMKAGCASHVRLYNVMGKYQTNM